MDMYSTRPLSANPYSSQPQDPPTTWKASMPLLTHAPEVPVPRQLSSLQMELISILVLLAAVQDTRQAGRRFAGRLVWYRESVSNFPAAGSSAAWTINLLSVGFGALSARDHSSYCFFEALSRGGISTRAQVCSLLYCTLSVALSLGTVISYDLVTRHSAANAR